MVDVEVIDRFWKKELLERDSSVQPHYPEVVELGLNNLLGEFEDSLSAVFEAEVIEGGRVATDFDEKRRVAGADLYSERAVGAEGTGPVDATRTVGDEIIWP